MRKFSSRFEKNRPSKHKAKGRTFKSCREHSNLSPYKEGFEALFFDLGFKYSTGERYEVEDGLSCLVCVGGGAAFVAVGAVGGGERVGCAAAVPAAIRKPRERVLRVRRDR